MKVSKKVKARMIGRVLPFLPPGTQVRQIMYTQQRSLLGMMVGWRWDRYGMIAVTDDVIFILDCGRTWRGYYGIARPKTVMGTVPRDARFGPLTGLTAQVIFAPPWRIVRGFYSEARAADQAISGLQTVQGPGKVNVTVGD